MESESAVTLIAAVVDLVKDPERGIFNKIHYGSCGIFNKIHYGSCGIFNKIHYGSCVRLPRISSSNLR